MAALRRPPPSPRPLRPVSRRSRPLRNGSRQPPEGGGRAPPRRLPRGWQTKHSRRLPLLLLVCLLPFPAAGSCSPGRARVPCPPLGRWAPAPLRGPAAGAPCPASAWLRAGRDGKLLAVSCLQGLRPAERGLSWFPSPPLWAGLSRFSWNFAYTFGVSDTIQEIF